MLYSQQSKTLNPACLEMGSCQKFCGMCELELDESRKIIKFSLFGLCRRMGYCIFGCGGCKILAKQGDCTAKQHPKHHMIKVSDEEIKMTYAELLRRDNVNSMFRNVQHDLGTWLKREAE